ncbi:cadherin domain-containing protein [Microvirga sp. KLBC 81]|uniref:cadherin domain-containing protein n=1 Tax=Microvirga sp. KLBC 81 TaxID=1862707 RepID=UPI0014020FB0|nr:cadherin domain-containing protein [Microvirga sp. KLBC 81]
MTADKLEGAVFRGGAGTDTLSLSGGGIFDLTLTTLSSIETIRGTSRNDTIYLDARTLAGVKTLSGGGGSNILQLAGSNAFDFRGKSVSGFSQIKVASKTFHATFSNKALALLVNAKESQNDSLRLVGGTFTETEITQLHRQGVDTIIDDNGIHMNAAPDIRNLSGERVYTSGGRAFLDRGADATVGNLDDKLSSLTVTFEDIEMRPGRIAVADDYMVTVPDGLIDGGRVMFNGTIFGTLGMMDGGLRIDFNPDATAEMVEALLHSLVFEHTDPDPSIRTLPISIELTDEGGRTKSVHGEVLSGGADIRIFDIKHDEFVGAAGNDTFATDVFGLTEGDVLDGGEGTEDTLLLSGGGDFDLSQLGTLTGIEVIKGSNYQHDWITVTGSQLAGIVTIDGGAFSDAGTSGDENSLNLKGTSIDLTGKTITNFSNIILRTDEAAVTIGDKAFAPLLSASLVSGATIELVGGGTFTSEEKGALFRQGFTRITDNSGSYINEAPDLGRLDGDESAGIAGTAIFIDAGRNATLSEDDQLLRSLTASVAGGTATDILSVATIGTVQVLEMTGGNLRIYVNGINIGFIALSPAGSSELSIQFNEKATPDRVQEVIRALTYKDTTGTVTAPRDITITVTDYTYHSTSVEVRVEQEINQKPTDMALDMAPALELAANGTIVGVLSATDPNAGLNETLSYTLLNNAGGRFELAGNVLKVKQGTKLDYEQASSHEITVRIIDKLGLTFDKTFTIDLTDVASEMAVGTSGRDIFVGGEGADRFYGKLGNDVLKGGLGQDIFVFNTRLASTNIDAIRDFSVRDDTIWLSRSIFTKAGPVGTLSRDAFWTGPTAHNASDRIIYNRETGALSYDADGNGAGRAVKFAQLTAGLNLSSADFVVI